MRVGIIAIQHESNTLVSGHTDLDRFRDDTLLVGEAIRDAYAESYHEVAGFFAALHESNVEAVPLLLALATPGGPVTDDTLEAILAMLDQQLDGAPALDGMLVAPHGAGVSEKYRDMDGYWLTRLRNRVGVDMPIVCTLDAHANVSPRMIAACNATITYRSNPHLDQYETGQKAGRLLAQTLRGEVQPVQALAQPPVAISIDQQETAAAPCTRLYQQADAMLQRPGILSNSINLGFPYADVEELGTSFIVVADGNASQAQSCSQELADWLVAERDDFACQLTGVQEAIRQASQTDGSVCLLDMGDNVGGGSPGDGTILAHALHDADAGPSFVCLYDPEAAARARAAGVGQPLPLAMGGKTDNLHGKPLEAQVQVQGLYDGIFSESQIRHGGRTGYDMGKTAVVRSKSNLTIMLISKRIPPFSAMQLTHCDLDPNTFKILTAKGVNAPIAAYQPYCQSMIRVNTPGVTCADMTQFDFQYRRRPLFPFE